MFRHAMCVLCTDGHVTKRNALLERVLQKDPEAIRRYDAVRESDKVRNARRDERLRAESHKRRAEHLRKCAENAEHAAMMECIYWRSVLQIAECFMKPWPNAEPPSHDDFTRWTRKVYDAAGCPTSFALMEADNERQEAVLEKLKFWETEDYAEYMYKSRRISGYMQYPLPWEGRRRGMAEDAYIESSPMHTMLVDAMFAALNIEMIDEEYETRCVTWVAATRIILMRYTTSVGRTRPDVRWRTVKGGRPVGSRDQREARGIKAPAPLLEPLSSIPPPPATVPAPAPAQPAEDDEDDDFRCS